MVGVCLVWWVALSRRPKKREPDLQFTANIRQKRGTASNMISTSDLLMYSRLVRADRVKPILEKINSPLGPSLSCGICYSFNTVSEGKNFASAKHGSLRPSSNSYKNMLIVP